MRFNPIDHVILFGGAPLLVATARWLREAGMRAAIYTSPRHMAEPISREGTTLRDALEPLGIPLVVTEDINAERTLGDLVTPSTLGLGLGEAWSFSPEVIGWFGGRLLDFMGIPHPRYRGGAHYTWMILRGDRTTGCNLQVVNDAMVQGEFDSGAIVRSMSYVLPDGARTPEDYFDAATAVEVEFLRQFLADVRAGAEFTPVVPDESRSLFLPRLNTRLNGWIDWSWSGVEIERFICAFDEPYPGASTELEGEAVQLKGAALLDEEAPFHPFQSGLVTRIHPSHGVVIATRSGHLAVRHVLRDGRVINDQLALGSRLHTPAPRLEQARLSRPQYGARPGA